MAGNTITVNILGDAGDLKSALEQSVTGLDRFQAKAKSVGQQATSIGRSMTFGLTLPIAGAFKIANDELTQSAQAAAQTTAVIRSTGGAAHVTAAQVDQLAQSILNKTGIDDEQIKAGENMLLTFRSIRNEAGKGNDIFTRATKITTDLSVAMGQDMKQSAIQVGKALNDPIKGLTNLQRVGVQFTSAQKAQIQTMVANNDLMGAQKIILGELNKEFGGSANTIGKTFAGQLNIAKEQIKNTMAAILSTAIPVMKQLSQWALSAAQWFGNLPKPIQTVGVVILGLVAAAGPLIYVFGAISKLVAGMIGAFQALRAAASSAAAGANLIAGAFTGATVPMAATVVAIGAVVAAFVAAAAAIGYPLHLIIGGDGLGGLVDAIDKAKTKGQNWSDTIIAGAKASEAPIDELRKRLDTLRTSQDLLKQKVDEGKLSSEDAIPAYAKYNAAIGGVKSAIAAAKQQQAELKAQNDATKQSLDSVASSTKSWKDATDAAKQALEGLQSTVLAQQGGLLGLQQAQINTQKAQQDLTQAVKDHGPLSAEARDAALNLQQARLAEAQATDTAANSQDKLTQEIGKHGEKIPSLIAKLKDEQATYGDTNGVIQAQIDKLFSLWLSKQKIPGDVGFSVHVNGLGEATQGVINLNNHLTELDRRVVNAFVKVTQG